MLTSINDLSLHFMRTAKFFLIKILFDVCDKSKSGEIYTFFDESFSGGCLEFDIELTIIEL